MTATLLIAAIGLTDIARSGRSLRARWVLVGVVWAAIGVLGIVGLAIPPLQVAAVIVIAVAWMLLMQSDDSARPRRLWPVAGLVIAVLVAAIGFGGAGFGGAGAGGFRSGGAGAGGSASDAGSPLATAWERLDSGLPLHTVLAAIAIVVVLTTTGNIVVRASLGRSHTRGHASSAHRVWELRVRGRAIADVGERSTAAPVEPSLKGGRLIGPIERVLIVVLALTGNAVLIAALVAAKGVVRFPEISEDRGVGSKAEEFLVGSLTSWMLSAVAAGYLVIH